MQPEKSDKSQRGIFDYIGFSCADFIYADFQVNSGDIKYH